MTGRLSRWNHIMTRGAVSESGRSGKGTRKRLRHAGNDKTQRVSCESIFLGEKYKVEVMKERILEINPDVDVR